MMMARAILAIAMIAASVGVHAQDFGGGPIVLEPMDHNEAQIDAVLRASVATARSLKIDRPDAPKVISTGNLLFPLRLRPRAKAFRGNGITNFVDIDPTFGEKDFACGNRTYPSHGGTDFVLYPHMWRMMDAIEVDIVAAAPGVIINKGDGNFDRQCTIVGNALANFVTVLQDDGHYAFYWHMKKGSVTSRAIGKRVAAGDRLGAVGSSGRTNAPHLHFELRTQANVSVDPFAGACGARKTRWKHQPEYLDTGILRIATHSATPPTPGFGCYNPHPKYSDKFTPGAQVWGSVYLRDPGPQTTVALSFIRPNGQVFATWTSDPLYDTYPFSWFWGAITLPSSGAGGVWKVRSKLQGETMEHAFMVGTLPAATTLKVSPTPATLTVTAGATANFDVTVRNMGTRVAIGCNLAPDAPLAAVWNVRQLVPAAPASELNRVFDLAVGATKKFRLSIKPKAGYKASAIKIPIRATCLNANSPATAAANTVTLTF